MPPNHIANPAKMLITFVGRRRGEALVCAAKSAGARGSTLTLGKALHSSRVLRALSLADVQQDIIFTLLGQEADSVITAVKAAAASSPARFAGVAIVLDVPEMFIRKSSDSCDLRSRPGIARSLPMESGYTLITVIVNAGYGDDAMAAARRAGASGGSILTARGTGTEEDVKFFGITLVPEKEMLLIVAEKDKVRPIIDQISAIPTLNEPGGGILFNMNVEEFIVLGQ